MNLYRLKIGGIPFDKNGSYTEAELGGNMPYVAFSSNPSAPDYDDISSIVNWDLEGKKTGKDSVFIKNEIKLLFEAKTGIDEATKWATCTDAEKDILAKCWLVSPSLVAERIPNSQMRQYYYGQLVKASVPARQARVEKIIVLFGEALPTKSDRVDLYNTVKTSVNSYVSSGDSDLIDYMNSSGAYDVTTGFESKAYYDVNLLNLFNAVVRDGIV